MKRALITGIGGFVGSHLTDYLISQNIKVFGIMHPNHNSQNLETKKNLRLFKCDILNKENLYKIFKKNTFDYIFHLAAFSSPAESFKNPKQTLENNIFGELNLLEILSRIKSNSKILIIGSADEYGAVDQKFLPVDESAPLGPVSPYAVSKVAQDLLGFQFYLHYKLNVVRVRPFNHIGPRQSTAFVVPAIASQIARLELNRQGEIRVGNLNTWRDFTDVRDISRAYLLALQRGKIGEVYNIGSGTAYKIDDILKMLLSFTKAEIKVTVDKKLFHEAEVKKIYCNFKKFKKQTGWEPKIPISQSLFDTIVYEREKINKSL